MTTTPDTLANLAADFVPRLMAVVKIYQQQDAHGLAVDAELFRAVSRLVAAQALPAAEPVAFVQKSAHESELVWSKDEELEGLIYDYEPLFAAPQAAQQAAQATAGWVPSPLAKRCYTMSETHLSGHRVIIGFEHMADAQAAHTFIANIGESSPTKPDDVSQDQVIELAQAMEQLRAEKIVEAVKVLPAGGHDADMPTPFQAGYQLACEEITHRLLTEEWDLCARPKGAAALPQPQPQSAQPQEDA